MGSQLPATFYDQSGKILCVSYTAEPVQGNNDCKPVSCSLDANMLRGGTVRLVVNDDGKGGRTAVECRTTTPTS